jgi:Ni/Fe-hydrogenase subunit HybB-like protein
MLLIGCMNSDQALEAIDWRVYITIAFAFGVSAGGWSLAQVARVHRSALELQACWQ